MLPDGHLKKLTNPWVSKYVEPIFEQRWHLFAPEPLTFSARLVMKCMSSEDWIDPTQDILKRNSTFPFVHLQKSIFLFNSISAAIIKLRSDFLEETRCSQFGLSECEKKFKLWIKKEDAYIKAQNLGYHVCRSRPHQLAIYIEHAKAFNSEYTIPNKGVELLELD